MKQPARPKGRSTDRPSFGPIGDLIRKHRLEHGHGPADVAKACACSVQFISNIEHGRAPLPWDKLPAVSDFLKISMEQLQAANLSVRSDFQSFAKTAKARAGLAASTFTHVARDKELQEVLQAYQVASIASRRKFVKSAIKLLSE